jgi:hypothetical protein
MGYSMIEVQSIRHFFERITCVASTAGQWRSQSVRTRPYARLFFHGCHHIHIIQFRQQVFPLQRREGRDEKLAVREHRQ